MTTEGRPPRSATDQLAAPALPRGLDDVTALLAEQHDIRFDCRTSYHLPAIADLDLVCTDCAEKWWAVTVRIGQRVQAVLNATSGAKPSTVPDHLPDNDESRGHGSVR